VNEAKTISTSFWPAQAAAEGGLERLWYVNTTDVKNYNFLRLWWTQTSLDLLNSSTSSNPKKSCFLLKKLITFDPENQIQQNKKIKLNHDDDIKLVWVLIDDIVLEKKF